MSMNQEQFQSHVTDAIVGLEIERMDVIRGLTSLALGFIANTQDDPLKVIDEMIGYLISAKTYIAKNGRN